MSVRVAFWTGSFYRLIPISSSKSKSPKKLNDQSNRRASKRKRSIKINQKLLSFGFFLLIAALLWFFNALNKEYYTDLIIPVKFINLPDNKLQVGQAEANLIVNVSAFGYQVIDYKASSINPVLVDFKKLGLIPASGKKNSYYILTSSMRDEISSVLGTNLKINKIRPDSLIIELVKVVSKKVPIRQNFNIEFRKQFMLKDSIKFVPDSVVIKGKESVLDTINAVYTENSTLTDIHDSSWFETKLMDIKSVEFKANKVNCLIKADQFTELEFKLPVYILNEPQGYSVKLFPSEVKVIFNVGFTNYHNITSNQFRIVADYLEIEKSKKTRILLNLDKKPANVSNIRIYPQSVDYIIEKYD
jgi:hypothetical protein